MVKGFCNQNKRTEKKACKISGKIEFSHYVFVVAFSYAESKEEAPQGGANNLRLFSDFFQSINKNLITGIGAQNGSFIIVC